MAGKQLQCTVKGCITLVILLFPVRKIGMDSTFHLSLGQRIIFYRLFEFSGRPLRTPASFFSSFFLFFFLFSVSLSFLLLFVFGSPSREVGLNSTLDLSFSAFEWKTTVPLRRKRQRMKKRAKEMRWIYLSIHLHGLRNMSSLLRSQLKGEL